jgi:hypothetical protein
MSGSVLRYRYEPGRSYRYLLQMRVTAEVESTGTPLPITQIVEIRGSLTLAVRSVDGDVATIDVVTEPLSGEVPTGEFFFGPAAVDDPFSALPKEFRATPRGVERGAGEAPALDALFPALPAAPVRADAMWIVGPDGQEATPETTGAVHLRFLGRERGEDGAPYDVVATFTGQAWTARPGGDGTVVQGETRRMTEIQLALDDGWAARVDGRVESTLRFEAPAGVEAPSRTVRTTVELLFERAPAAG